MANLPSDEPLQRRTPLAAAFRDARKRSEKIPEVVRGHIVQQAPPGPTPPPMPRGDDEGRPPPSDR